jgi:hydrogenase maturation protease
MNQIIDDARDEPSGIIKIIGIGQSLRGDDAAGLVAVRFWQERYQSSIGRSNLQVELAELPGVGLLSLLEGTSLAILVDAVHSNSKPGTVHLLSSDQLDAFTSGSGSAHGWGVAETLSLGEKLMPTSLPEKIILVGIEAGDLSLGESLSPQVEQAIPEAARLIQQLATQV